ncbi:winged helix-turn-helix domain-containing protein [Sphingosinicella terrae]|uniref:winged helix-turn-helix domain-containing protein n=1 Tax=Sphingosinicella terrae TaxID=2172047 RepID=UPI000E0CCF8B|nr:winged helix-turn-helix domain-containing protein [Sphingosinicella terrae]
MPPSVTLERIAFEQFVVDRADERVLGPAGPLKLGNKAFRVLLALVDDAGRLVTKDALLSSVWDGTIVTEASLTSAVRELRRALGDDSRTPRFIESVYGRGYRFIAPLREAPQAAPGFGAGRASSRPTAGAAMPLTEGRPPLVLVSEFRDEAVREHHPYFAAELREEVLSGLARFREILLVADDRPEDQAARAHADEPGYQLTATLLPEGDGIKVIARARRLSDSRILWGETMSLAAIGMAGGVEKIVRRIAGAALPAVDEDLSVGLPHEPDDVYNRYLMAKRRSFAAQTFDEARAAADALEVVIADRPGFALAYPPLARLYNTDFAYTALGSSGAAERARALQLAKDGLAADRGNVHAFTVLGFCHLWHDQRGQARHCFEQALALNPYNPVRLEECATGWMYLGDLARARDLMDQAAALNPIPGDGLREDSGRLRMIEGDYERAHADLEAVLAGTIFADLYLGVCEVNLVIPGGEPRLRRWRDRVERCWHGESSPSNADIMAWIQRHHPLHPDTSAGFFGAIERALEWISATPALQDPVRARPPGHA